MMKIGIGVTVHNRNEQAEETIAHIEKLAPKNSKIVIVDDASTIPFENADFRFNNNVGIAVAKNKCIELLYNEGCTHFFLFDDDTYPIKQGWQEAYINTGINHLCMTFDKFKNGRASGRILLSKKHGLAEYKEPCGCMLYFTREVVDKVGGMDPEYGRWGYEHVGYSMRIYNNFLTPRPFMDIENSTEWIYSKDWAVEVDRSVPNAERIRLGAINKRKYESEIKSSHYIGLTPPKDVIITTLFHTLTDTQRGEVWDYKETLKLMQPLNDSCAKHGIELVVLDDKVNITPKHQNPYFARWIAIREHLEQNHYGRVWCVDATDVEVLRNPFLSMENNCIYVGCEPSYTNTNVWLRKHHTSPLYYRIFTNKIPIKNAGILGGSIRNVLHFIKELESMIHSVDKRSLTDMALFNMICCKIGNVKFGDQVNTEFKAFKDNGKAWFKHK